MENIEFAATLEPIPESMKPARQLLENQGFTRKPGIECGLLRGERGSGWRKYQFTREGQGGCPPLEIVLRWHQNHGVNMHGNSRPRKETHYFYTPSPISEEQVLGHIEGYLEAAEQGRAYSPD